jgi:hypothetical protein
MAFCNRVASAIGAGVSRLPAPTSMEILGPADKCQEWQNKVRFLDVIWNHPSWILAENPSHGSVRFSLDAVDLTSAPMFNAATCSRAKGIARR